MFIAVVSVHVKQDRVNDFKVAITENASQSVKEPGVIRFDVIQQGDDPTRFLLIEVYHDETGPVLHKQTAHYLKWKADAEDMMAEPRQGLQYIPVFPADGDW